MGWTSDRLLTILLVTAGLAGAAWLLLGRSDPVPFCTRRVAVLDPSVDPPVRVMEVAVPCTALELRDGGAHD